MNLRISGLRIAFGAQVVFHDVNAEFTDIRSLVLIGPSGGGKSTLLRALGGMTRPEVGCIEVDGEMIPFEDEEKLRRHRVRTGFVFQAHNLFPHLTALENITLPLVRVHHQSPQEAREQALELLDRFRLADHAGKRPAHLSGGQQQRVAIARAMAVRPRLLFFDEPTSALDPEMTAEVLDMIAELRAEGRDFVLATHEMGFARRVADCVALVGEGGIPAHGPVEEMMGSTAPPVVQRFLERVLR